MKKEEPKLENVKQSFETHLQQQIKELFPIQNIESTERDQFMQTLRIVGYGDLGRLHQHILLYGSQS